MKFFMKLLPRLKFHFFVYTKNNNINQFKRSVSIMNNTALIITIIGAVNWLLAGLFKFDLVASIFGGQAAIISRIIYVIVGLAGLWCITLLFRNQGTEHSKA